MIMNLHLHVIANVTMYQECLWAFCAFHKTYNCMQNGYCYMKPSSMLSLLHIVDESGYSITGLVVGIIFAALLVTVAVFTLGILCK